MIPAELPLFAQWPTWLLNPSTRIEKRFASFHSLNPHVYQEFERRALEAHRAGARRIGVKAIAERIRWDIHIRTLGEAYKINNTLVALYARLLLCRHPELSDLIETRERQGKGSGDVVHASSPSANPRKAAADGEPKFKAAINLNDRVHASTVASSLRSDHYRTAQDR